MNTIIPRFNYNFSWDQYTPQPPPPPLCIFNLTMVYNIKCSVLLMTYISYSHTASNNCNNDVITILRNKYLI